MKPDELSAAASRLAAAISQIEAEVARMNGLALPANGFPATMPSADVPTVPMVETADEMPADTRTLLPLVDLSGRKVVSLCVLRRHSVSSRKHRGSAE